jgi:hypothetical protein
VQRGLVHLGAWIASWLALYWLWFLLVGEWNKWEWVAAPTGATLSLVLGLAAWRQGASPLRPPLRVLARSRSVPARVFVDFGILVWALVLCAARRRVVRGTFRAKPFPDAGSPGARIWVAILADYSPNAYVVDVDPRERTVLVHDLVPNEQSEQPA